MCSAACRRTSASCWHSSAAVDRFAVHLILVEPLVEVETLEQELEHRCTHLRAVGQAQLLQRRGQLGEVAERTRVSPGGDSLADLEHAALFEAGDDSIELRGGEVPAEHRADRAALEA